jgi:hypothetical protein
VGRRVGNTSGLRQLLIAQWDKSMLRWRIPGEVYAYEEALKGGEAVAVSSSRVMGALFSAGLPCNEYCFGGRYFKSVFVLDENDRLVEAT